MGISFTSWSAFNLPPMVVNLTVAFLFLYVKYSGWPRWQELLARGKSWRQSGSDPIEKAKRAKNLENVRHFLEAEYEKLGPIGFHQLGIAFVFILVVVAWVTRDLGYSSGWKDLIDGAEAGDSSPVMLGVVLLFILPRKLTIFSTCTFFVLHFF